MLIRDATESNIAGIATTHIAAWRAAYRDLLPKDVLDNLSHEKRCEMWRGVFLKRDSTVIVAVDAERVAGFVCFGAARDSDIDPSKIAEILTCYVHPDFWRCGIGKALWDETHARLRGKFAEAILWTWRDNTVARRFYERMGFSFDGTEKLADTLGAELVEVRYRRVL